MLFTSSLGSLGNGHSWIHSVFSHGISLTKSSKITKCWEGELDWFFGEAIEENGTTLRYSNIAMENGPFEDGFPIKHRDIPLLC